MNVLQPQVMKNGGSILTPLPKCPNMVFATVIRLVLSDAKVQSSVMLSSLNAFSFLNTPSLKSLSSGAALIEKLRNNSFRVSKEFVIRKE